MIFDHKTLHILKVTGHILVTHDSSALSQVNAKTSLYVCSLLTLI